MLENEPSGQELINRYKNNYFISKNVFISEEMVMRHWELEKKLTKLLLESTHENRWETFDRCYTKLYSELKWLNKYITSSDKASSPTKQYGLWSSIIGMPPKDIYEIGSGKGELICYLASFGYRCKGTEITRARGKKYVLENPNIEWGISDGIHLDNFEDVETYDVVISNQVIEHMHPDDITVHFKSVRSILKNNGRYIFSTPHSFIGPSDISRVFKKDKPMGMHLKEYSYQEIQKLLNKSGFKKISACWRVPPRLCPELFNKRPIFSNSLFLYMCILEN